MNRITIHPGEVLREEFVLPLNLDAKTLGNDLHLPVARVSGILDETHLVTADSALRLARYFGTTAGFWMNLQAAHDLSRVEAEVGAKIENDICPRADG